MFGDETWDKSVQHSLLNLVSHHEKIKPARLWSFLISAVCQLRALQLSGYFGQPNQKVGLELSLRNIILSLSQLSPELGQDEVLVGKMLVHLFELMQFNTHGITESTDSLNRWEQ